MTTPCGPCDTLPPDPVWPLLETLRECLCDYLGCTVLGAVCRCAVEPGSVAFDFCCEGCSDGRSGMAWVREVRRFPTGNPFPASVAGTACGDQLAVEIEMGVVRCTPGPDASGQPPTAEALEENAEGLGQDVQALYAAVCCALGEERQVSTGPVIRLSPSGGCAGSTMLLTVAL